MSLGLLLNMNTDIHGLALAAALFRASAAASGPGIGGGWALALAAVLFPGFGGGGSWYWQRCQPRLRRCAAGTPSFPNTSETPKTAGVSRSRFVS